MNQFKRMAYPYVAWIAVMILAPMLMIVMYAFIEKGNDVTTFRFTISNFTKFFSDKVYIDVLYRSLYVAILTTRGDFNAQCAAQKSTLCPAHSRVHHE